MAFPAFLQRLHQLGTGAPAPPPPPAPAPTYTTTTPTTSGCPFGFGGSAAIDAAADAERQPTTTSSTTPTPPLPPPLFGAKKVQLLYETYIHLPDLRDVSLMCMCMCTHKCVGWHRGLNLKQPSAPDPPPTNPTTNTGVGAPSDGEARAGAVLRRGLPRARDRLLPNSTHAGGHARVCREAPPGGAGRRG